jgi:hypothetical protein
MIFVYARTFLKSDMLRDGIRIELENPTKYTVPFKDGRSSSIRIPILKTSIRQSNVERCRTGLRSEISRLVAAGLREFEFLHQPGASFHQLYVCFMHDAGHYSNVPAFQSMRGTLKYAMLISNEKPEGFDWTVTKWDPKNRGQRSEEWVIGTPHNASNANLNVFDARVLL